ncbi:Sjogren's syndrome/scleroderma autoantigen 1 family protein [Methanospirillum stamsii]|uniref:Sjogrens syndrome scleroderma autoantigen 1 n=1 Tax=Methanospirillum stamsii TaxID=1277351 RepID=A0A2V2MX51_9EURY|nr:autoantigen p27 domain-containing protein [Methanospirillum stamsii]PWR70810.1 hypothetical protein DLD82_15065 [Methanospirillum stamsii]
MTPIKSPDEIMAEYLLKGGKMLAKTCSVCHSPLFEYKGETLCVVCKEENKAMGNEPGPMSGTAPISEPATFQSGKTQAPGGLEDEFAMTLRALLKEAREEKDSTRILHLMDAVKHGAEAYALLLYGYGRRDNS